MKIPKFTDDQLEAYADNVYRDMTSLESQLAITVMKDRTALRKLRDEIAPLARQIIDPPDNTFSRQLKLIEERLAGAVGEKPSGEEKGANVQAQPRGD